MREKQRAENSILFWNNMSMCRFAAYVMRLDERVKMTSLLEFWRFKTKLC
jgi:hypothetical protein